MKERIIKLVAFMLLMLYLLPSNVVTANANPKSGSGIPLSIPASWKIEIEPPKINWPIKINWEAAQLKMENDALNSIPAPKQTSLASPIFVPWENRPIVYWNDMEFHIDSYVGQFRVPRLGISQQVYWDFEQSTTDHPNKMNIWGYSGLPGERELAVNLYDHNYQTGCIIAQCQVGEYVYLDTVWGNYIYQYTGQEIAQDAPNKKNHCGDSWVAARTGDDPNMGYEGDFCTRKFPNGHVEGSTTSGSNNGELYFITCFPLTQKITTQRLVMRFKCIDGPRLVY